MLNNLDIFSQGQIRLAELSVYNWGSFNGLHTAHIHADGTLITGDNGAGKSTFIDGLMALLLPVGKVTFNVAAAQGDKTDRSLLSYMRGSYGTEHDGALVRVKSKRESSVVTALRALYKGDDGSVFTLTALFWTTQASNSLSDVKRVYAVAKRNLSLKELLDAFGEGEARSLKQFLRDDPTIECCDEKFSDYQTLYRKLLYMENKNAPALLSRALGLKKIDDLTELIRNLVLEPSSIKEDARKVVGGFADLVAIHNKLVDTREQRDALKDLPKLSQELESAESKFQSINAQKKALRTYLATILAGLWGEKIQKISDELDEIWYQTKEVTKKEESADEYERRCYEGYLQLGGSRIEQLKKEIKNLSERLIPIVKASSNYQEKTLKLGLINEVEHSAFLANKQLAISTLSNKDQAQSEHQDKLIDAGGHFGLAQKQERELNGEIEEIRNRPDSNIDFKYQKLRDELVSALKLDAEQCKFIGELIDVKPDETEWQGSIERALGGLRTTLAVPHENFSLVTRWLNSRHTGLHVRVQVVKESKAKFKPPEFKTEGYLRKLVWRDHPFREWLKTHLNRYDLSCVETTEELDITPFSMTQQGLIHKEQGRFEKKDLSKIDDKRFWNLGFSNKTRLASLVQQHNDLKTKLTTAEEAVKAARKQLNTLNDQYAAWEVIETLNWEEIDAQSLLSEQQGLQNELTELENNDEQLESAEDKWQKSKAQLTLIRDELTDLKSDKKIKDSEHEKAKKALIEEEKLASNAIDENLIKLLDAREFGLSINDLDEASIKHRDIELEIDRELNQFKDKNQSVKNAINKILYAFKGKDKWKHITIDWPSDLKALPDFLAHYEMIESEGLPALVEQFAKRLNKHTTQSLAHIQTKLEDEKEEIAERIERINQVLKRTEFKAGSYLKLGWKREKYPHVIQFEQQLRDVLSLINSDDHEARYQMLSKIVETLEKSSNSSSSNTLESLRLLEPRYQMSFYAEELDAETGEVKDVLESSTGKSGGEKESFAGIVVAASLTYVLTPEGYDHPVYSTVFLDEAFSNTAESVSRRVLRVFKELGIHVNLITPYKNLNLARESASSLLIATRNSENHDSQLCEVTWEEVDQKMQQKQDNSHQLAENMGIELSAQELMK